MFHLHLWDIYCTITIYIFSHCPLLLMNMVKYFWMRCLGFVCALKLSFCTVSYCLFGIFYQNCLPVPLYYKKVVSATSNDINKEYFKNLVSVIHFQVSKSFRINWVFWDCLSLACIKIYIEVVFAVFQNAPSSEVGIFGSFTY